MTEVVRGAGRAVRNPDHLEVARWSRQSASVALIAFMNAEMADLRDIVLFWPSLCTPLAREVDMEGVAQPDWWREELQSCVLERAARFAELYLGRERMQAASEAIGEVGEGLLLPLLLVHLEVDGRTAASGLSGSELAEEMASPERHWLEAERAAVFSAWVVKGVLKGKGLLIADGLGGAGSRFVQEPALALPALNGSWLLARVLEWQGLSYLAGAHPSPLCEHAGVRVAAAIAGRGPGERLLPLANAWRRAIEEGCARCEAGPPMLEGEPPAREQR